MPTPVYIICCESGVEDRNTGLASLFNVVERIIAQPPPIEEGESKTIHLVHCPSLRIVAAWRAAADHDFDSEFESQIWMLTHPQGNDQCVWSTSFRFAREAPNYRATVVIRALHIIASGQLIVESRIRKVGKTKWLTQRYVIDVSLQPPAESKEGAAEVCQ